MYFASVFMENLLLLVPLPIQVRKLVHKKLQYHAISLSVEEIELFSIAIAKDDILFDISPVYITYMKGLKIIFEFNA